MENKTKEILKKFKELSTLLFKGNKDMIAVSLVTIVNINKELKNKERIKHQNYGVTIFRNRKKKHG